MGIDYKFIADSLTFKFPYNPEQWAIELKYENYHCHKDFTNVRIPDSPVTIDDYAKRIKELGSVGLYSGEHGTQGNHFQVYECAEKNGLKYIHSSEAYWVKDRHDKDGTNCHIYIAATCAEGREDLNYILSIANEDGFYTQPRIDLDLLFSVKPENFIVTSACIAGWKYDDADEIWLRIAEHFGDNFFLEVQAHNTDSQKRLNRHILDLAEKHNLQIIAGVDSHYITAEQDKKRNVVLAYKKMHYEDEDGWYLDYPDGKTEWRRFQEQGVLSGEQICRAMMNTNVFVTKCQQIVLDRKFKIPCVYPGTTYDERVSLFKQIVKEAYAKEKLQTPEKWDGVEYETSHIVDSGVVDYFLMNYRGLKEAIENYGGVLTTTSRGSMASFIVNRLLGFTTVDRFNSEIPIYPERFLTKDRVLAGSFPD